jgi:hypothetical protein
MIVEAKGSSWVAMKLTYIGDVAALLHAGGGKLSLVGGDPGESRKQQGGPG